MTTPLPLPLLQRLANLVMSREKLWFNQMADEDKKKVELETQQVVTKTIIFYVTIVKN